MALGSLGRQGEALAAYDHALALGYDEYSARHSRAWSLGKLGRFEELLAEADLELACKPDSYDAWWDRGWALLFQKRYKDALAAYERAVEIRPNEVNAHLNRAAALYRLERYDDTLAAYERAIELSPDNLDARYWKGVTLQLLGRFDEALATFDDALKRAPGDERIRANREALVLRMRRDIPDKRFRLPDGRTLGYLDFGDPDGAPLFFFHGMPGSRLEMVAFEPLLKELHIRLITPERPGYGLSTYQPRRKILDWPDDVAALADHLGIARFAVLGVSCGGAYAAACAYHLPDRVTALGLASSAAPPEAVKSQFAWTPTYISWRAARYSPMVILRLVSSVWGYIARHQPGEVANGYMRRNDEAMFWQKKRDTPKSPDLILAPVESEIIAEPFRQGGRGYARDSWLNAHAWGFPLDRITVPAHLWHGTSDVIAPPAWGRYLAASIPNCQATNYPDERHDVLDAHAREILTTLLDAE